MRKKVVLFLITCVLMSLLVGCACTQSKSYQEVVNTPYSSVANGYFTLIAEWDDGYTSYQIVYANDTNVKYLICYDKNYNRGSYGITPLYNPDGTLQTYNKS